MDLRKKIFTILMETGWQSYKDKLLEQDKGRVLGVEWDMLDT